MASLPIQARAPRFSPGARRQAAGVGIGALAILAAPTIIGNYGTEIAFRFLLYAALGQAWNLLAGYGGLVSLGSAAFIGTGAYVLVGLLNHTPLSIPFALLVGGIAAGVLAAVVSPAMFRMRGLYFTVGTLALGEALRLFMVNESIFGGASGLVLANDPPSMKVLYYYAAAIFFVATIVVSAYTMTRFSIPLRAVRDDEDAAAQMGVRAFAVKFAAFVVAGVLMGAAGGLQALRLGAIEPYGMFGLQWSIDILTLVIIGGMGSRLGPLVGAAFVIVLSEALADYPAVHTALTGVILIVIIRFAPRGLVGLVTSLRRRGAR
jgi:branched-chain amino acid transport system permease protein